MKRAPEGEKAYEFAGERASTCRRAVLGLVARGATSASRCDDCEEAKIGQRLLSDVGLLRSQLLPPPHAVQVELIHMLS